MQYQLTKDADATPRETAALDKSTNSRILQFHRDQASDSGEVVTPFMQDGTYPTRNFATLEPILLPAAVNMFVAEAL